MRLLLLGFGTVNRTLTQLLFLDKKQILEEEYGLNFVVNGVADSQGGIYCKGSLPMLDILEKKQKQKQSVVGFANDESGIFQVSSALELLEACEFDVLVDGTPCAVEPGRGCIIKAMEMGKHVVMANKSPLVHCFAELMQCSKKNGVHFKYSAAVCGGLPVINVCKRDLIAAKIKKIEGIFNSTSNYILHEIGLGHSFESALTKAKELGIAEADPSLDIDGWDTAYKLIIIANTVIAKSKPIPLEQVSVVGIRGLKAEDIQAAHGAGDAYKLIATVEMDDATGEYRCCVKPQRISCQSFLGGVNAWEMGIVIKSDNFDTIWMKIDEPSVIPTASAVLRDLVHVVSNPQ